MMDIVLADVTLGAPQWVIPAAIGVLCLLAVLVWSYARAAGSFPLRLAAGLLKAVAIVCLALCLIEPLFSSVRPRPGANLFVVAADGSRSMHLTDQASRVTRGEQLQAALAETSSWQARLSQDFDVRRYVFGDRVQPVADFSQLNFDGNRSSLGAALTTIFGRYRGRPLAGLLLLTDGNATDLMQDLPADEEIPPIYPVVLGESTSPRDIRVTRVSVSQTNFETSPVTIYVEGECVGYPNATIVFQLLTQGGLELQRHSLRNERDGQPLAHRFLMRPEEQGINFYRVRMFCRQDEAQLEHPERASEATLENNSRLVLVDQAGGPYRVLYVGGRPNWEFKFLRRAIQEDDQVHLVGLVRIAKKEPKFTFRGHLGEKTNPLFRGFGNEEDEDAEQYDQPVLLRLGVGEDGEELRDGFPKSAEELFRYDALILDELDASFFSQDQLSLIQQFVSERGGGFLMLGGRESFASGKYDRTPIGDLLPVYLDPPTNRPAADAGYKLQLTREGWLQPWTRLRTNEQDEEARLAGMPSFRTLNPIQSIKPGASVLAHVESADNRQLPALVVQRFGKGRSAALLVGDLWRWNMRRANPAESDLEKAWRQTVRWLVADVPARVDAEVRLKLADPAGAIEIVAHVRDEQFQPLDNATVTVQVETPTGNSIELTTSGSDIVPGGYEASFSPRKPGAYRAQIIATAADGSEVGRRQTGWVTQPATLEFQELQPNRELLAQLAERTGGEVIDLDRLDDFVSSLPNRKIPITEPWVYPLWHQWGVLALAISCLAGEWGLRRWKGLGA